MKNKYIFVLIGLAVAFVYEKYFGEPDPVVQALEKCNSGDMFKCWGVGNLAKRDGDISKAKYFYKKACDGGEARGCLFLKKLEQGE